MKYNEQLSLFNDPSETDEINIGSPGGSMDFSVERNCFNHLRDNVDADAKAEYELGVKSAVERYNTAIYENRFIVGGVVEVFTLALMRSTGIDIQGCGAEAQGGDLILPSGVMFSVKSSFRPSSNVILINTRGESRTEWTTATLFILTNIGLVYGDPSMVNEDDLHRVSDNLQIKANALLRISQDPSNVILMDIPEKPPTEMAKHSLKASDAVARELMREFGMNKLLDQV